MPVESGPKPLIDTTIKPVFRHSDGVSYKTIMAWLCHSLSVSTACLSSSLSAQVSPKKFWSKRSKIIRIMMLSAGRRCRIVDCTEDPRKGTQCDCCGGSILG